MITVYHKQFLRSIFTILLYGFFLDKCVNLMLRVLIMKDIVWFLKSYCYCWTTDVLWPDWNMGTWQNTSRFVMNLLCSSHGGRSVETLPSFLESSWAYFVCSYICEFYTNFLHNKIVSKTLKTYIIDMHKGDFKFDQLEPSLWLAS